MAERRVEVTSADIARLARVRPSAVTNWRRRHLDFPSPVRGTDKSPTFDLDAVSTWLKAHGRLIELASEEALWRAMDAVRDGWPLDVATTTIGLVLLDRHRHGEQSAPHNAKDLHRALLRAVNAVVFDQTAAAGLHGLLPPTTELTDDQVQVLCAAIDAAGRSSPAAVFDHLCSRYFDAAAPLGYTATAPELAALVLDLAAPAAGTLIDPACGSGELLLAAHDRGYRQLLGQELNPGIAALAALRLAFASGKRTDPAFDVFDGDALRKDVLPLRHAAAVVCNPPFGERNWGYEELTLDARWEYGVPPRGEPELAWVQHALAHTVDGGVVVMVMPPAAASRPSGRRIRRQLISRGALQAVFCLPPQMSAQYQLALHLWILRSPSDADVGASVLLADFSTTDADTDEALADLRGRLVELWRESRAGRIRTAGADSARMVPAIDLLDDDVDVTPRRHLPLPLAAGVSKEHVVDLGTGFAAALADLGAAVPNIADLPDTFASRTVTVHDLVQMGAVFVRRSVAASGHDGADAAGARVVTADDLINGRLPGERGDITPDPLLAVRANDVLVPVIATRFTARVAVDDYAGAFLSPSVLLLRPDPEVIDPWFLAGYLSSSDGAFQATSSASLSGSQRFDPRRVRVPLPAIDTQRRYGAVFRAIKEFERRLRGLDRHGHDLIGAVTDALVAALAAPVIGVEPAISSDSLASTAIGGRK